MKKTAFLFLSIILSLAAKTQNFNLLPGILGGVSYYQGDINHKRLFYSPQPTFGILVKHDFNNFYSVRMNISRIGLSGNDSDFPSLYQKTRNWSFVNNIYELGLQGEFNFLEFVSGNKNQLTTYITAGLAMFYASAQPKPLNFALPLGAGLKYSATKRMNIALEWAYRSTFSDKIDLLPDNNYAPSGALTSVKQITNDNSKDLYSTASIIITYNFASSKKWCPAYKKK